MWLEMLRTNDRLNQADVTATFEAWKVYGAFQNLVVRNSGNVPVFDVRVRISPDDIIGIRGDRPLREMPILKQPIPVLLPGSEFKTIAFDLRTITQVDGKRPTLETTVSFRTPAGEMRHRTVSFDADLYATISSFKENGLHEISNHLDKVTKHLEKIAKATDKLDYSIKWAAQLGESQSARTGFPQSLADVATSFRRVWEENTGQDYWDAEFSIRRLRSFVEYTYQMYVRLGDDRLRHRKIRGRLLRMSSQRWYLGPESVTQYRRNASAAIVAMRLDYAPW